MDDTCCGRFLRDVKKAREHDGNPANEHQTLACIGTKELPLIPAGGNVGDTQGLRLMGVKRKRYMQRRQAIQ